MCPLFGLRRNSLQSASSRITPFRTGIDGIAWDYMGVNGTAGALMASNWDRAAIGSGKTGEIGTCKRSQPVAIPVKRLARAALTLGIRWIVQARLIFR